MAEEPPLVEGEPFAGSEGREFRFQPLLLDPWTEDDQLVLEVAPNFARQMKFATLEL